MTYLYLFQTKLGSAGPYEQTLTAGPVLNTDVPQFLSPPCTRHPSPPPAPVPTARNHSTSPIRLTPRKYVTSRYLPPGVQPRYVRLPKLLRPPMPPVRYPRRLEQWGTKSKIPPKEPSTLGGTTIDELKKYIASGTKLPENTKKPKIGRRKSIEDLKQYLATAGSFETARAQKSPAHGNVPRTPAPPNVTPRTSLEHSDNSNIHFDTPITSPHDLIDSQENVRVENIQLVKGVEVDQLKTLKTLLSADVTKVDNSSQFTDEGMVPIGVATSENMWQIVESVGDVAEFLDEDTSELAQITLPSFSIRTLNYFGWHFASTLLMPLLATLLSLF